MTAAATMPLWIGLDGPDQPALLRALAAAGAFGEAPPPTLRVGSTPRKAGADWLERWVIGSDEEVTAEWDGPDGRFLIFTPGIIVKTGWNAPRDPDAVLALLARLPFEVASFNTIYPDWGADEDADGEPYLGPSFGRRHYPHGWACAFKGAGHDRLVCRRWLDYGPWRLLRGPADTTLVQFHDLTAGPDRALAEARPGHQRMGITETGGYIQNPYLFTHEIKGNYDASQRLLKIIVHGRDVSQEEMLDAAAARRDQVLGPDQPLDRIAYVFMEEREARTHLHELWLHCLECWTIVDGLEVRLDADYAPPPDVPRWVADMGGNGDHP